MTENLPDTNVGNIEYICKQDAIDIVVFECGKWTGLAKEISKQFKQLPAANVVSKADITVLLEETEKELVKGTDEMSIARCFIVSIMGIVKCKIMQMGKE